MERFWLSNQYGFQWGQRILWLIKQPQRSPKAGIAEAPILYHQSITERRRYRTLEDPKRCLDRRPAHANRLR